MGERKGNEGAKMVSWSTLSGKGWTKRPFSGVSTQCEALRAFSTLLGHFGVILGHFRSFWGLLGPDRKSTRLNSSHLCASRMPSSA